LQDQSGFPGTEHQCTEDEHDDEDENDSQTSEFELKPWAEFWSPFRGEISRLPFC
jgi:hypothetical protein